MGYEIPGGIGVAMAAPDRDVFVMVGDGSYLMMPTELVTAVQEGVKVIVVLVQNHGFASIGALSEQLGSQRFGTRYRYRGARTAGSTAASCRSTWRPTPPASGVNVLMAQRRPEPGGRAAQGQGQRPDHGRARRDRPADRRPGQRRPGGTSRSARSPRWPAPSTPAPSTSAGRPASTPTSPRPTPAPPRPERRPHDRPPRRRPTDDRAAPPRASSPPAGSGWGRPPTPGGSGSPTTREQVPWQRFLDEVARPATSGSSSAPTATCPPTRRGWPTSSAPAA